MEDELIGMEVSIVPSRFMFSILELISSFWASKSFVDEGSVGVNRTLSSFKGKFVFLAFMIFPET
jgi:hypothetical protein